MIASVKSRGRGTWPSPSDYNEDMAISDRRIHQSTVLAWWCLGICLGLVMAKLGGLAVGIGWLSVTTALLIIGLKKRHLAVIPLVIISGCLLGSWRGVDYLHQTAGYQPFFNSPQVIAGRVAADPRLTEQGGYRYDLTGVKIGGLNLPGEVYVTESGDSRVKRGDVIEASGRLVTGFGNYQAAVYRADVLAIDRPDDLVRDTRERFAAAVRSVVREPEASLGLGFVVGQRSALPLELDDQLRAVGLTHIVVASGYNLTILVRFARRIFSRTSRFLATSLSVAMMMAFAAFSGFSPSMNRAVLVTGLSLVAWHYGRRFHPMALLLFVAALTAMVYPVYIWGDLGWYLSFLAFGGVLMGGPLLARLVLRRRQSGPVEQVLFETTAAQLMTLPLILVIFGQLPAMALIANLLVAPAIPAAMAVTTLAGLLAMVGAATLAGWLGFLVYVSVGYVVAVSAWLSAVPGAVLAVSFGQWLMIAAYAGLIVIGWLAMRWLRLDYRRRSLVD